MMMVAIVLLRLVQVTHRGVFEWWVLRVVSQFAEGLQAGQSLNGRERKAARERRTEIH
jgi:hypothetical protein